MTSGASRWRSPTLIRRRTVALATTIFVLSAVAERLLAQPAAGDPLPATTAEATGFTEASAAASIGSAIFEADWIPAPDVSDGADGLGPLFNATSCSECHGRPGSASLGRRSQRVRHILRVAAGVDAAGERSSAPHPDYGRQLQDRAIAGHTPEGRIAITWVEETLDVGPHQRVQLRLPVIAVENPPRSKFTGGTPISLRRPLALDGVGLIAAIADADIAAGADPDDADGDGISGRLGVAVDPVTEDTRIARFGWKASIVSLAQQTAVAFSLDMGLSSWLAPNQSGDCTQADRACLSAPHGGSAAKGGYEVSAREIALIVSYLESLPPPPSELGSDTGAGRAIFDRIGCAACHRPAFKTGSDAAVLHLSDKPVTLYSDLLLHDMGEGLADNLAESVASGQEWRTTPLWGLSERLSEIAAGAIDGLLHDGRARSVEEAVLWHAGEATHARDKFAALSLANRRRLIAFLSRL